MYSGVEANVEATLMHFDKPRTVSQGLCGENLGPRACLFFISRYTFYYTVDRK